MDPTVPGRLSSGPVGGDHRAGLGGAIAFQQDHAGELLGQQGAGGLAHLLRPAHCQRQAAKVAGLGRADVLAHERIGGEQDVGPAFAHEVDDHFRMQGGGILESLETQQRRHHRAHRQAEGVEHGQGVEHRPSRIEVDVRPHLRGVGDHIGLGQHHAARIGEAAGGEQDHPDVARLHRLAEQARRGAGGGGVELVGHADRGAHVLQIDQLGHALELGRQLLQPRLGQEATRGENQLGVGHGQGRLQVARPRGEVEHHRRAPDGLQGEEGHAGPDAGGQQQGHPLARFGPAGDLAAQGEAGADQVAVGEGLAVLVLQDLLLRAVGLSRVDQGVEQAALAELGVEGARHGRASMAGTEMHTSLRDLRRNAQMGPHGLIIGPQKPI